MVAHGLCTVSNEQHQNLVFKQIDKAQTTTVKIERFSSDCQKTKTKAITPTNHNTNKQRREPIPVYSNYL